LHCSSNLLQRKSLPYWIINVEPIPSASVLNNRKWARTERSWFPLLSQTFYNNFKLHIKRPCHFQQHSQPKLRYLYSNDIQYDLKSSFYNQIVSW
jgi:hypothetical protein